MSPMLKDRDWERDLYKDRDREVKEREKEIAVRSREWVRERGRDRDKFKEMMLFLSNKSLCPMQLTAR